MGQMWVPCESISYPIKKAFGGWGFPQNIGVWNVLRKDFWATSKRMFSFNSWQPQMGHLAIKYYPDCNCSALSPCISDPFYFALFYFPSMYLLTYHISYAPYTQGTMCRLLIYPIHQNNTWVMVCTKEIVVEGLELGSPKSNERNHESKYCRLSMLRSQGENIVI